LTHASTFDVYTRELMLLAAGDVIRFTKNFVAKGGKCRNNDLAMVQTVTSDHVTTTDGRVMPTLSLLHLDQGIAVTSHASQGKTVDNVIVSAPVAAFAQVNEAQLYVSMSRARRSMHLVTDCKEALREAVSRPSERISALELSAAHASKRDISLDQQLQAARLKKEIQKTVMKDYKVLQRDFGHEQHHPPPPPQPEHDRTQGPGMSRGF
jgi:UvrD-like helicase C-terminal domain